MKDSLLEKLIEYSDSATPFHMPGHKRVFKDSQIPYSIDITEVEGFDNLHDMKGVLKETANLAKMLYNSEESFPLVNGASCGILAGIYSMTRENKNILIARNCHKSVYNAVEILELNAHYVLPKTREMGIWGEVLAQDIEKEIVKNNIGVVVITSPTYEGVISDASQIYGVCKKHGAYLLVDCAHGAHFPNKHTECDICVMSLHKTMPSLTQTAVLNVYSKRIDLNVIRHGLSVFETTSPSYILLASIDECLRYTLNNEHDFCLLYENLGRFYDEVKALQNIKVFHFDDMGKIIISACDGQALAEKLRAEGIEVEMVSEKYVLAMATVADTKKTLKCLSSALFKIDKEIKGADSLNELSYALPEKHTDVSDALRGEGYFLDFKKACGKVCQEYIWSYPPGAPIVVAGEIISQDIIDYLATKKELKSTRGKFPQIYVKEL